MGESGSGKNTIVDELEKRYGYNVVQSYTTRPKRFANEKGHIFISEEEFFRLKNLAGYTYFDGSHYGATAAQIEECDLYVIDPAGVEYFKTHYTGDKSHKAIYVSVPKAERKMRMYCRGDGPLHVARRLASEGRDFCKAKKIADLVLQNNNAHTAVEEIYRYICQQEKR